MKLLVIAALVAVVIAAPPAAADGQCVDLAGAARACTDDRVVIVDVHASTGTIFACIPEAPCPNACLFANARLDRADPTQSAILVYPVLCRLLPIP